ncbi:outer membrane beta-barrel family protein [Formosa haliotis]|uniref:outer membrane beta-barrel family protein n=1 Tax=Formosa haliotis TaxID=1555194 RepID=UPI0008254A5B|nr:outer membrane beta-barrel family protein [Formosa haliotis]
MKKTLTIVLLLFSLIIKAQNSAPNLLKTATLTGRVLDANLNQPLPYVTVVIKNLDGSTLTGSITDDNGLFSVTDLPLKKLQVVIQYVGFKRETKTVSFSKNKSNINLGDINLTEDVSQLDEVTVVAEVTTIQQKVDRKVINIGKDLTTVGPTASDIMNNLPSVSVDQQTGNISMRGNANVRVMVDGKLSNVPVAQLLKQIPSTSIKSIELITNPSAKYNPEGMSGIINIILHKNTNIGFNGNINLGLSHEYNAKFNSSIDLNYRNGKFNIYGNYGNNTGKNKNYGTIDRLDDLTHQIFNFNNNNKSHLYKVGIDFYMNDNNTISFFTNQNVYDGKGDGTTDIVFPSQDTQFQTFNSLTDNLSSQYNLAYKHEFKKEGEKLDIEIDYNDFGQTEDAAFGFVNIENSPNYKDHVETDRTQTTINVDYVNPLSEKAKLELGAEARLYNTQIDYESTGYSFDGNGDLNPTPSTDFDYTRDIYSAYITYSKTYEKWSYQAGARFEQVAEDANALNSNENTTESIPFSNDYFQVYPSAFITYNPSEKNTYQFSASRRVDRPGLSQVNPIREWSTPRISSYGNTALQPQFTNSVELNYTRKLGKGTITGGVFYRFIEDEINRAVYIDRNDLNKVILTYDNFDNTSAYGIELSSNYKPTPWWNFNASFDLYGQTQSGITEILNTSDNEIPTPDDIELTEIEVDNLVWNFRMNNTFKATKRLNFSLFGMYRGAQKSIQFQTKPMIMVNTGLQYSFLNDAATFSFNYNDIFNSMKFEFDQNTPFPATGQFNWESNTWYVGLSYRFGGNSYKALSRKNRDRNEKSSGGGFI